MRAIIVGWFSFSDGHATAGDLLSAELVSDWFHRSGIPCDIAAASPFEGDVDYEEADPGAYTHAAFVCGPFDGRQAYAFIERFHRCRLLAFNVTLPQSLDVWNPFDYVVLRDSPGMAHPDLVFGTIHHGLPVAGLVLVEDYPGSQAVAAAQALRQTAQLRGLALVEIDTRLDRNATGYRTPQEIESVIARMDVVLTTRLHGMVMALKHGVPVLAIDPEPGGAKIVRQAREIGWRHAYAPEAATLAVLQAALDECLQPGARPAARTVARAASDRVATVAAGMTGALQPGGIVERAFAVRREEQGPFAPEPPDPSAVGKLPRAARGLARRSIRVLRAVRRKLLSMAATLERGQPVRVRITSRRRHAAVPPESGHR
jgi:hypothetical protein